ncbi:MAG: MinD/ParA family protein [Myxococcales bacterium]|nr:MinD/ParA family protein [Myxococcales bacterium]
MKSISITSGKGGVGKTNISINLALALAKRGLRVLLLDADMGLANVDVLLGIHAERTLYDVVTNDLSLRDILVHVSDHLDLLPAHSGVLRLERLSDTDRTRLVDELDGLCEGYDALLIDTGAGIGENVLFFNDLADRVLLVTVPEPTALTDTYAMIKILNRSYGVDSMSLIVNQAATAAVAANVHEKLEEVSNRFLGLSLTLAGSLPSDPAVCSAVQARTAVLEHDGESPFARGIRAMAARLASELEGLPRRQQSFWRDWIERQLRTRALSNQPRSQLHSHPECEEPSTLQNKH